MKYWLPALLILSVPGCEGPVSKQDARERSGVIMRRAAVKTAAADYAGAARLYREALDSDPRLARAHLELALVLDGRGTNLVEAIYHYGRYLALRPSAEKKPMIVERIRKAEQAYAARILNRKDAGPDAETREALRRLRARITVLQDENSRLRAQVKRTGDPGGADRRTSRTYTVKRGDTLSSIAQEMYDDSRQLRKILDANRDRIPDPDRLRPGQVLVIP